MEVDAGAAARLELGIGGHFLSHTERNRPRVIGSRPGAGDVGALASLAMAEVATSPVDLCRMATPFD